MAKKFNTVNETVAYVTSENVTNTDERHLVAGSVNMLIDETRKVRTRNGNSIYRDANNTANPVRQAVTWNNSTSGEINVRCINGVMQVDLGTLDGVVVNDYINIASGFSATVKPRFTTWFKDSESLDYLVFVWGDDNLYAWSGCMAVVASVTGTTITKAGTDTWGQARALSTGSKILVNVRTGTEYTYTGGETTLTLTGIADTTGIIAGDILVQKIITTTDKPQSDRINNTVFGFENQIAVGSDTDEQVYLSKNIDYTDFTFSSPRIAGQGVLFTLDDPARGFGTLEDSLIIFAGRSSIYQGKPQEITVGTTQAETFAVKKYQTGLGQSAQNQEVIQQVGNTLVYLSYEPALREIASPSLLQAGQEPRTLSNPIKPDFDAEDWTDACAIWFKNGYYLSAPTNGRVYILQYREDADGKLRRFWQPPQTMFISAFTPIGDVLYGHSAVISETYKLFDTDWFSDQFSDGSKLPIHCVAKFAYRNYGDRVALKNFDEYFVEGEISGSTQVLLTLYYDFGGYNQSVEHTIDGADYDIVLETLLKTSMAQQSLGSQPLGGAIQAPEDAAKFRVIFEQAREDFVEMQDTYETNDVDKYWSIISRGANAQLAKRQHTIIKK